MSETLREALRGPFWMIPGENVRIDMAEDEFVRRVSEAAALATPSAPDGDERHRLLMPPHPGEVYHSSALCSCGEWQYDGDSFGALTNEYRDILREHTAHAAGVRLTEGGNK